MQVIRSLFGSRRSAAGAKDLFVQIVKCRQPNKTKFSGLAPAIKNPA